VDEKSNRLIYVYQSPFGLMSIRHTPVPTNLWHLWFELFRRTRTGQTVVSIDRSPIGWSSPQDVAQTVYAQTTGWPLWDKLTLAVFPASLDDWKTIDPDTALRER
jgi:hypothetical protein